MSIFSMVMEAMSPTYDDTFCDMVGAMESDLDCFEQFRGACGVPKYEPSASYMRMMSATEALNTLADHARLGAVMDTPEPQKTDYSAAFEAVNVTLDTTINPEQKEEILAAQRQEALSFYGALESFFQGE